MKTGSADTGSTGQRKPLGAPFQPAPGVLVLTASKIREFDRCRRQYFCARVLNLKADADSWGNDDFDLHTRHLPSGPGPAAVGLHVHEELHARHENPTKHHATSPVLTDRAPLPAVQQAVDRHLDLCPGQDGAQYLGGEIDFRWSYARKAVLLNGRVDALWRHPDGVIEVRDYKTGTPTPSLADDVGALFYGLLAAAHYPGSAVRVTYEYLGAETHKGSRASSLDITKDHLREAVSWLHKAAQRIREEQSFQPTPSASVCRNCPYRLSCDVAAQAGIESPKASQ